MHNLTSFLECFFDQDGTILVFIIRIEFTGVFVQAQVLTQLQSIVGIENVLSDSDLLKSAQKATFTTSNKIVAIIYPSSVQMIQDCMKLACCESVAIYPISRGKNWGNGSKVPTADNCILMDLSRLNKITDYNERMAYITIEPGVTQQQAVDFLTEQKSGLVMGVTGSVADSSVMGNVLERGDAAGLYGERCLYICGLEVVLPTGEIIRTGYKRYTDAKCGPLHRHGLGPSLDGLFLQSNFGVVTQMTLWLEPKPEFVDAVIISVIDLEQLGPVVDALHLLHLKQTFQTLTIWNDIKLFSKYEQYPYELSGNKTPLSEEIRKNLRKKYRILPWMLNATILSYSKKQAGCKIAIVKKTLKPLAEKLEVYRQKNVVQSLSENYKNVKIAYWRKRNPPVGEYDLNLHDCGLIWCMFMLPFAGQDVEIAINVAEQTFLKYGLEPNIALIGTETRTLKFLPAIIYDREVVGEDERAMNCHDEIAAKLIKLNYFPYRLGVHSMNLMASTDKDSTDLLFRLKKLFDPEEILSPGRYSTKPSL
ncbi:MAG: FAD-binding oxidoreductase [bacterium]|nr:FAD-binding oxidoreductase [bacterium]